METEKIRLTQYSHGAGCGCKISPKVLDTILQTKEPVVFNDLLLVGNQSRDDAAVFDMGNGEAVISTTDFFMPIVDDPFDFGRIAGVNAISDIYAMGGTPVMAIAVLGWPVNTLPPEVAQQVIEGGRQACKDAGIPLAGGHSIDSPEPIFGLAVTGRVDIDKLKRNDEAKEGDKLFLTKPLGIGILTTAEKKSLLKPEHATTARDWMIKLNKIGAELAMIKGVNAITDVTGFGLMGHLSEICEGSSLSAEVWADAVPRLDDIEHYIEAGAVPGGTTRNFESYGHKIGPMDKTLQTLFTDPQTSGGLLISVSEKGQQQVIDLLEKETINAQPIGRMVSQSDPLIKVV